MVPRADNVGGEEDEGLEGHETRSVRGTKTPSDLDPPPLAVDVGTAIRTERRECWKFFKEASCRPNKKCFLISRQRSDLADIEGKSRGPKVASGLEGSRMKLIGFTKSSERCCNSFVAIT